jgi:hypothetical protein
MLTLINKDDKKGDRRVDECQKRFSRRNFRNLRYWRIESGFGDCGFELGYENVTKAIPGGVEGMSNCDSENSEVEKQAQLSREFRRIERWFWWSLNHRYASWTIKSSLLLEPSINKRKEKRHRIDFQCLNINTFCVLNLLSASILLSLTISNSDL